jgi:hydroxyacylglutathione hydrolase
LIKVKTPGPPKASLKIKQIPVGTMANFVYLVVEERSKEALLVDSGWETGPIKAAAEQAGAKVKYAVATHEHFDHTTTLREAAAGLGAKVVAHRSSPVRADLRVTDGDTLILGSREVRVLHTPGHTMDSICLYDGTEVFTGDTLFIGTIGRVAMEEVEAMYKSLQVIMKLPPSTMIFPGHDYGEVPSRTIEEERATNPYLAAKDIRGFLTLFS